MSPNTLVYHPARDAPAPFHANLNSLSLTLPGPGLAYFALPAGPMGDPASARNTTGEAAGWNEAGVAVSATESIYNSPAALAADPPNEESGIIEDVIPSLLLPQATSARHGAALLGELVSKHGAGEAFGVLIADVEEAWYFESGSGHHWLAQRVPHDSFFISANQGRLQEVDLNDESVTLASPGLLDFAVSAGLWDPAQGRPFNFFEAFMRDGPHDVNYSYPRVCLLQGKWGSFCPGQAACQQSDGHSCDGGCHSTDGSGVHARCNNMAAQPVFLHPKPRKLSALDVMAAQRNHWDGSSHDPYSHQNPREAWRPIALLRTGMAHVTRLRSCAGGLPDALSVITYTAMSTPKLSPFIPLYKGLPGDALPAELTSAKQGVPDGTSLFWKARRLQALVFQDWPLLAPHAAQAIVAWEAQVEHRQRPAMESQYIAAYQAGDEAGATGVLVDFTSSVLHQAGRLLEKLTAEVAQKLGLPGVPSDQRLLEMLEGAAEAYAFEPTSDDEPPLTAAEAAAKAGAAVLQRGDGGAGGRASGGGDGRLGVLEESAGTAVQ